MPDLQLDFKDHYPSEVKWQLAEKMSRTYADMMSVGIRRISVAVRELGEGGILRIPDPCGPRCPWR